MSPGRLGWAILGFACLSLLSGSARADTRSARQAGSLPPADAPSPVGNVDSSPAPAPSAPREFGPVPPALFAGASLVPGAGQALRGEYLEGATWLAATAGLFFQRRSALLRQVGFDLWQYNLYDAWRDAGGGPARGHTVYENYVGFLDPRNLWDPIGASVLTAAAVSRKIEGGGYPGLRKPGLIAMYGAVGLGEEALFRGFLFPQASEWLGSPWLGAPASSLAFALFHGVGGSEELRLNPFAQRFGFGMILSWMLHRNRYDLRKGIFAHAWYDVLLEDDGVLSVRWGLPLP